MAFGRSRTRTVTTNAKYIELETEVRHFINASGKDFEVVVPTKGTLEVAHALERVTNVNNYAFDAFIEGRLGLESQRPPPSQLIIPLSLSLVEELVFTYFVREMCPVCVCFPSKSTGVNPYLDVIVPLAVESPIVLNTVLAVSARQLALLGQRQYTGVGRSYMDIVTRQLPKLLRDCVRSEGNWDEALGVILMMCFAEISQRCDQRWLMHLDGAKEIVRSIAVSSPMLQFFLNYFLTHEVMGETAWCKDEVSDMYEITIKNNLDIAIDVVMGCLPYLVSLVGRILSLGKCYESLGDDETTQKDILLQRDCIEMELDSLVQVLRVEETDQATSGSIETIAEIKRLTAVVYLFARIDVETHLRCLCELFEQRYKTTQDITTRIFYLCESIPTNSMSLLWTMFVVGLTSAASDHQRTIILDRFAGMQRARELASVKMARRVVERVWRHKDLHSQVMRWRDMVRDSSTISLA